MGAVAIFIGNHEIDSPEIDSTWKKLFYEMLLRNEWQNIADIGGLDDSVSVAEHVTSKSISILEWIIPSLSFSIRWN